MPSFFLSFNVLRRQAQLKGWSNRPEVSLTSTNRWRKKNVRPSPPLATAAAPPSSNWKPTASATTIASSASICVMNSKPSLSPGRSNTASKWKGATTNVLLIHPICRCCTDVVNCITRPYKRRASKGSMHTAPTTSTSTSTTAGRSCSGRKSEWDGLPSTHYMRLWPQPDHERLREAKFNSPRSRFAPSSCSPTGGRPGSPPAGEKKTRSKNSPKKQKRRSIWKFWPSIF